MHATLPSILALLVGHWVGDFVLQWDSLVKKKRASISGLSLHVSIYSLVILIVSLFLFPLKTALVFTALNALLHFVTDLNTRRFTERYSQIPRKLFLVIGFDQLIHTTTMIVLLEYLWPRP